MALTVRALVIGATLLISCAGCSGSSNGSPPGQFTQLKNLDPINVSGDVFADIEFEGSQQPRVVGEVRKGKYRIIAYTQGESCGVVAVSADDPKVSSVHLDSQWSKESSNSAQKYPAGPYSFTSGAGSRDPGAWTSLACSKNAMVIEYASRETEPASTPRGSLSIEEKAGKPPTLTMVVGSEKARSKILPHVRPSN